MHFRLKPKILKIYLIFAVDSHESKRFTRPSFEEQDEIKISISVRVAKIGIFKNLDFIKNDYAFAGLI